MQSSRTTDIDFDSSLKSAILRIIYLISLCRLKKSVSLGHVDIFVVFAS